MSESIGFHVPGLPAPKGSRTVGVRRDGSHFTRPASGGEHAWTDAVALVARSHRPASGTLGPPYAVALTFALPRPARPAHGHPSRSDLDKLIRGALDGLARAELIVDDRHVTHLVALKRYAEPGREGVEVTVQSRAETEGVNEAPVEHEG